MNIFKDNKAFERVPKMNVDQQMWVGCRNHINYMLDMPDRRH